jgi:hypothetical protein
MIARNQLTAGMLPRLVREGETDERAGKWLLDLSNEAYHADKTALSRSGIVEGRKSMAHFLAKWLSPPEEPTPALVIGHAFHLSVLEPDLYKRFVVVQPEFKGEGMRKAKSDWLATLPPGAVVLKEEDKARVDAMRESVMAHPLARRLFEASGMVEASGYWVDPETGILCRCRPDKLLTHAVPDLKSTIDASPDGFARAIVQHGYHIQSAHYGAGIEAINGEAPPWLFVPCEKDPPYACAVYVADEAMLARGRAERAKVMRELRTAIETDTWPGYGYDARTISLPTWAFNVTSEVAL